MKARNKNMVIIHFLPLERYPPAMNLINYVGENKATRIYVISTRDDKKSLLRTFTPGSKRIKIIRTPSIVPGSFSRIFNYLYFYLYSFYLLVKCKPVAVLYFETISSWPALMYKKLRANKVKLLVHYHEYIKPDEYTDNMKLIKWMHKMESKMYRLAYEWISHTNEIRLEKFISDQSLQDWNAPLFHVMPNYPSKFWGIPKERFNYNTKTKLVYVGSLGYDNMYLKQIVDWVLAHNTMLSLDLYAYNIDSKAKNFLHSVKSDCINYKGGCNYEELPII